MVFFLISKQTAIATFIKTSVESFHRENKSISFKYLQNSTQLLAAIPNQQETKRRLVSKESPNVPGIFPMINSTKAQYLQNLIVSSCKCCMLYCHRQNKRDEQPLGILSKQILDLFQHLIKANICCKKYDKNIYRCPSFQ